MPNIRPKVPTRSGLSWMRCIRTGRNVILGPVTKPLGCVWTTGGFCGKTKRSSSVWSPIRWVSSPIPGGLAPLCPPWGSLGLGGGIAIKAESVCLAGWGFSCAVAGVRILFRWQAFWKVCLREAPCQTWYADSYCLVWETDKQLRLGQWLEEEISITELAVRAGVSHGAKHTTTTALATIGTAGAPPPPVRARGRGRRVYCSPVSVRPFGALAGPFSFSDERFVLFLLLKPKG